MNNKIAVVTGANSGIGRETAIALHNAGCTVYDLSRRNIAVENIKHINTDVTNEENVLSSINQIVTEKSEYVNRLAERFTKKIFLFFLQKTIDKRYRLCYNQCVPSW